MFRYAVSPPGARKFRVTGRFDRSGRACCFAGNAARRARVDISAVAGSVPAAGQQARLTRRGRFHAHRVSHPAPVLALAAACSRVVPARLLLFGVFCAVLPDLDVIGFKLGIRYADLLGHRGFSHSLLFALLMGLFGAALAPGCAVPVRRPSAWAWRPQPATFCWMP